MKHVNEAPPPAGGESPRAMDRGAVPLALAGLIAGGILLAVAFFVPGPEAPDEPVPVVVVPAPLPPVSGYDTLGSGETLGELLVANGLGPASAYAVTEVVRGFKSPRSLRPGLIARFTAVSGSEPDRIVLQLSPDSLLDLVAADTTWNGAVHEVPVSIDTVVLAGLIESSLWFAELSGDVEKLGEDEFSEYVFDLADVFAWKVDFTRDIRRGDAFRAAIERERRPDGSIRSRRFLAIELRNRNRDLQAIPFQRPDGRREYFDVEGEALKGVFLRYPVPFRITSGFSRRRYHPVLKRNRAHLGIDYGAPHGTPVKATAAGTVVRAGTWGSFGRIVEIRHVKNFSTRYAHLSSIARGVTAGAFVQQGQIIGRVGSTGLATGPHLHYEFLQAGTHRNPATLELPSAERLEDEHVDAFRVERDQALALLDAVPLPVPSSDATAGPAVAE
ncbi:MAG: M23 family metallopeptidase [marine benthic group bacterium]|nr:M23 family metallopeptidase [Gemmatimonadota bacterium]